MSQVVAYVLGIVVLIIGIGLSVALHELGHMIPAKRFGVKVPEYFIGFGPRLWSVKRGETEYGVKAIWLGGYVKLLGMVPPAKPGRTDKPDSMVADARAESLAELGPDEQHRAFYRLSVPKKLIVMAGGILTNLTLGVILLALALGVVGQSAYTSTLASVSACVPADVDAVFATDDLSAAEVLEWARGRGLRVPEDFKVVGFDGTLAVRRALPDLLADGPGPHRALLVKEQLSSRMAAYRAGGLPPAFDPAAGGGSLMDLGVYPVSMAVHLFGEPARVRAAGRLLASGADSHGVVVLDYETLPDGRATDLEVVCLHSKTSRGSAPSSIASDNLALSMDDVQWPRRIALTGPQGEQDLSVDSDGPVLARELAEVCRLVARGRRESDLHPLEASLACVRVLARAREQVGVRLPGDE